MPNTAHLSHTEDVDEQEGEGVQCCRVEMAVDKGEHPTRWARKMVGMSSNTKERYHVSVHCYAAASHGLATTEPLGAKTYAKLHEKRTITTITVGGLGGLGGYEDPTAAVEGLPSSPNSNANHNPPYPSSS